MKIGQQIINYRKVAKDVEAFYISGKQTGTLPIHLGAPIDDTLNVNLVREKNFASTLRTALLPVQLHISSMARITDGKHQFIASSGEQRKHIFHSIAHNHFQKHLHVNSLTGSMSFANIRPHKTVFVNYKCKNQNAYGE
jgi:hypothetical protein